MFLIVMGGFLVLWILMITMGQRREAKKRQSLFDSLKKHDRVQTTGGVIGTIVEIKPETIVLRVDENSGTKITFARAAIVGVVKEAGATEAAKG
ncbi:MAG: preprotein translocase subunit YajC [Phycisphaerae bacterium]|nr:preprotein translocase subunit YajC [Phycisphaerae bacterium]